MVIDCFFGYLAMLFLPSGSCIFECYDECECYVYSFLVLLLLRVKMTEFHSLILHSEILIIILAIKPTH
jgi:hypothetical protein